MTDALGLPIIVGSKYAFHNNRNGFTFVNAGILTKESIDSGQVTIDVKEKKEYLYGKLLENKIPTLGKKSVRAINVFRVDYYEFKEK